MPWASVGGAVATSLVGGLFGKKKNKNQVQAKAFTPSNLYTPSGNATWNNGAGTATLSPELQGLKDTYLGDAGSYHSMLSQYFGPNKNDYYKTNAGYTPKSYTDYYNELKSNYTTNTPQKPTNSGFSFANLYPMYNKAGSAGSLTSSIDSNGLNQAIQDAMARDQKSNTTFDQAGYDTARAGFKDPSQVMYDKLRALSKPSEDQAHTDLESRLFSQGLLGQSNGQGYNPQMKAFDDATKQADGQRELTALTSTPEMMKQYQGLFDNSVSGVTSLDQIPNELLKTGANIGVGVGTNSIAAGRLQADINANSNNFWKSAAGGIGSSVENGINNYFKPSGGGGGTSNSMFSPFSSGGGGQGVKFGGSDPFGSYKIGGAYG